MGDGSGNGRLHDADAVVAAALAGDNAPVDDDAEDDEPLTDEEALAAAAEAATETDESLDERVETVVEDLDGVARRREGDEVVYAVAGREFAITGPDRLEVALDGPVAAAALKTGDTAASARGRGWVAFTPAAVDRFALDRAEAWVRLAHRRAAGR